jgi:lycopene cyclase domain-containing protein
MNTYAEFHVVFAIIVGLSLRLLIRSSAQLWVILQTAAYVTVIAFPWDHFAIAHGAWTYPDPGLRLFDVPLNDMVFIFIGSAFSGAILDWRGRLGPERQTETEHRRDEAPSDQIH